METYFEELALRRDINYNKYVMAVILLSILFIYLNFNYIKFSALNVTVIIYNAYIIFLGMIKISISIKDNVLLIRLIWPIKLKSSFTLLLNEIVETKILKDKKMIMHPWMYNYPQNSDQQLS